MKSEPLLEEAIKKFGSQQELASAVGVTPSAVSAWVKAGTIPKGSRRLVLHALGRGSTTADRHDAEVIPSALRHETSICGYFCDSAWSFNFIEDPSGDADYTGDRVWRTWNGIKVLRDSTFRQFFRYKPLAGREVPDDDETKKDSVGFGFLSDWSPEGWPMVTDGEIRYLNVHSKVTKATAEFGGYRAHAAKSVYCRENKDVRYEFVGFRTECPVRHAHLIVSLPHSLRGSGPTAAYLMISDFPMFFDFGRQIQTDRGELEKLILPWGKPLKPRLLTPDDLQPGRLRDPMLDCQPWSAQINDTSLVQEVTDYFSRPGRDQYIVTADYPPALTTILFYWPLPKK